MRIVGAAPGHATPGLRQASLWRSLRRSSRSTASKNSRRQLRLGHDATDDDAARRWLVGPVVSLDHRVEDFLEQPLSRRPGSLCASSMMTMPLASCGRQVRFWMRKARRSSVPVNRIRRRPLLSVVSALIYLVRLEQECRTRRESLAFAVPRKSALWSAVSRQGTGNTRSCRLECP